MPLGRHYFDYAATTPADPRVVEAMLPFFSERFGNPASPHSFGREALKALEDSRKMIADFLGAVPGEIVLTSGATEANNQAIYSTVQALRHKGNHIVAAAIEHHSVLEPLEDLARQGFQVTYLPVDAQGLVDPAGLAASITPQTILVCVMHANNEIGTIQPIPAIAKITRDKGVLLLVDAVQTIGHVPVDVRALGADLLSLSAHKFYGPKGVGALYVRKGVKLPPLLRGGDQEGGRRASTQNVAGIVGMARALELCGQTMAGEAAQQTLWRDRIITGVVSGIPGCTLNGPVTERLPNNAHFSFQGVQGESLLLALDMSGISASMGSACTSGALKVSHVLRAIGQPDDWAYGALRITLGRWTTEEQVNQLIGRLPEAVRQVRC